MTTFRLIVIGLLVALLVLEFEHLHQHAHMNHQRAHIHQQHAHIRQQHVHRHRAAAFSPGRRTAVTADTVMVDITRSTVERLISDTNLLTQARMVPSLRQGRVQGMTLYAIRPGSLFAALGIQNGDTILEINDRPVHQPDCTPIHDIVAPPDFLDISLRRDNHPLRMIVLIHDRNG